MTDRPVLKRPQPTERRPVIRPRPGGGSARQAGGGAAGAPTTAPETPGPAAVGRPVLVDPAPVVSAPAPVAPPIVVEPPVAVQTPVVVSSPVVVDDPYPTTVGRHERRLQRRRLVREQVAILIVLLLALAVTVALLAGQWLLNASVTGTVTLIPFSTHLFAG